MNHRLARVLKVFGHAKLLTLVKCGGILSQLSWLYARHKRLFTRLLISILSAAVQPECKVESCVSVDGSSGWPSSCRVR